MKKLLAILLSILTMFSALSLAACEEQKESAATTNFVFNGFDDFEKDFLTMRVVDYAFGSVDINRDKKYVKFGEASACFRPMGSIHGTGKPIIYLPTYSTRYEYDYKDMSKVEKISAWFYNDQDYVFTVGMGLQTTTVTCNQTLDSTNRTVAQSFALQPGWNYCEYELDPTYLQCTTTLDLTDVFGMFIQFEYRNPYEGEDLAPYIYVDDVRFHLSETPVVGSEDFNLKSNVEDGVWEIADFEDERQVQFFVLGSDIVESRRASYEVVPASAVSTTATSGKNVLKVTRRGSYTSSHSNLFSLSRYVLKEAFDNVGQDLIDNPHNYAFQFDYYNYSPVKLPASTYSFGSAACTKNGPTWRKTTELAPYTWGTFSLDMGWCDEYILGQLNVANPPSTYPLLRDGYTKDDAKFTTNPSNFTITFPGMDPKVDSRDKYVIIDNIRVVRVDSTTTA